jgi:hypothetical protein
MLQLLPLLVIITTQIHHQAPFIRSNHGSFFNTLMVQMYMREVKERWGLPEFDTTRTITIQARP